MIHVLRLMSLVLIYAQVDFGGDEWEKATVAVLYTVPMQCIHEVDKRGVFAPRTLF